MRLLLDTHILIWMINEPEELNDRERRILLDPRTTPLLSVVSLWELRLKWDIINKRGERKGGLDPAEALGFANRNRIEVVPLTWETAVAGLPVPVANADPFDRMLLTHAQQIEAKLLTRDGKLRDHPLAFAP